MKKVFCSVIAIMLILSCAFWSLFGCSNKEKTYSVLYKGGSNCIPNTQVEIDDAFSQVGETEYEYYDKFRKGSKKTVEIDGMLMVGEYEKSVFSAVGPYWLHKYLCSDGKTFCVGNDGRLLRVSIGYNERERLDAEKSTVKTEEECIEIANCLIRNTFNNIDLDDYVLGVWYTKVSGSIEYHFEYSKYVDGVKTFESICVNVTEKGTWTFIRLELLGRFSDDTRTGFDMERVDAEVRKRLDEYYWVDGVTAVDYKEIEYTIGVFNVNNQLQYGVLCSVKSEVKFERFYDGKVTEIVDEDLTSYVVLKDDPGIEDILLW